MASLNRIVLLDRWGAELFSGESMLSSPPPKLEDRAQGADDDEPCPETLRSSVLVRIPEPQEQRPAIEVTIADDHRGAA